MRFLRAVNHKIPCMPFLIFASFIAVFLSGCANSPTFSRPLYQDPTLTVGLESPLFPEEASSEPNSHPVKFLTQDLVKILRSIKVKKEVSFLNYYVLRKDPTPQHVFSAELAEILAPHLQAGFAKARPEEMVTFFVNRPREDGIPMITSGGLFVRGMQLSVVLANVDIPVTLERKRTQSRENPLKPLGEPAFHFVPESQQTILTETQTSMRFPESSAVPTLLIRYRQFLRAAQDTPQQPQAVLPQNSDILAPSVENKLRQLKSWYQEGLISESEYQKKRKEILESF